MISVVGTGELERVADRIERLFEPLRDRPGNGPALEAPKFQSSDREEILRAGRGQSHVVLAWGTGGLENEERVALDLAASVLASPAGRLFQRIGIGMVLRMTLRPLMQQHLLPAVFPWSSPPKRVGRGGPRSLAG